MTELSPRCKRNSISLRRISLISLVLLTAPSVDTKAHQARCHLRGSPRVERLVGEAAEATSPCNNTRSRLMILVGIGTRSDHSFRSFNLRTTCEKSLWAKHLFCKVVRYSTT